ncbi:hypothetical protein Sjap_010617 [Stephania japonica]|uniref:Uncharacterized protein n=1 Tax=Stephania japonica TaxID=461633 RepID=A0AAP0JAS9_9MAGN
MNQGLLNSPWSPRNGEQRLLPHSAHASLTSHDVREALRLAGQGPVSPGRPPEAELDHGGVAFMWMLAGTFVGPTMRTEHAQISWYDGYSLRIAGRSEYRVTND